MFRSAAFPTNTRARGNSVRDNAKQEELIARQQKQIDALPATVRKISERVELSAFAPRIAANED